MIHFLGTPEGGFALMGLAGIWWAARLIERCSQHLAAIRALLRDRS